jgi:hypothetical protein
LEIHSQKISEQNPKFPTIYQPLKKAYVAMGKKGSWNTSSQNTKDWNQSGGFCTRGSLNSLEYQFIRFLNWKKIRSWWITATWPDRLSSSSVSEDTLGVSHCPAPSAAGDIPSWLLWYSLYGHLIKTH